MPENEIIINLEDVMRSLSECTSDEEKQLLCQIYTNDDYNELGRKKISKDSKVYQIINKIKEKDDTSIITIDQLSLALTIATYECNHSICNKLKKYIHQFLDNVSKQCENDTLIYKIKEDNEVINYIKKFSSLEDYQTHLVKKQKQKVLKIQNIAEFSNKKDDKKSYVMIS